MTLTILLTIAGCIVLVLNYHQLKNNPARGESTIIMHENVNDSIEMRVARCSEGNMS